MHASLATRTVTAAQAQVAPALVPLLVPIDSVELHPRNPRLGNVEAVAASLRRFSQQKPIVVQASTRWTVAGNHLLRAARSLGWTAIAANIVELDDASATAFMLADNRTSDIGGYDEALLAAVLGEQQAAANLAATGYDADAVAAILAAAHIAEERDPDAVPAVPEPAAVYVKPGQLWALGRHRIFVGDSTRAEDVARLTGGETVDCVWTDPPYGCGYVGKTARALKIANDNLGVEGTRALVRDALALAPLRPGGSFYVASPAGPDLHLAFLLAIADAGLAAHQTLVWVKDRMVIGHSDYSYRHETLIYGWLPGAAHRFRGDRRQDSIWEIARPARNELHPTVKPVELVTRALRNSTAPDELVFDPFGGSGTTIIAAEQTGRIARAMEIDPRYAQVSIERWAAFTGKAPAEVA
jgi:site-specific DNA-methyltransferase (adenine-specific)